MNWQTLYRHIWIMALAGLPLRLCIAQGMYDPEIGKTAARCPDKLVAFTDRSLYAVNEEVQFTALLQTEDAPFNGPGSSVLYAELVSASGRTVAKGKYLVDTDRCNGNLQIPSTALSGNYYLRCYTRWMRNFGEAAFSYIPLQVVNPFLSEVDENGMDHGTGRLDKVPAGPGTVTVEAAGRFYAEGDTVRVTCSLPEDRAGSVPFACITVVPEGSIDVNAWIYRVDAGRGAPEPFRFSYLPEAGGMALSGTVSRKGLPETVPGTRVYFTIMGNEPAFFTALTDARGRFIAKVPYRTGSLEMFVTASDLEDGPPDILIDNDFSADPLPFNPAPFSLTEQERTVGSRICLNMQLDRAYRSPIISDTLKNTAAPAKLPFYGKPEISVILDQFINLPNMEEVIENLITRTQMVQRHGEKGIMIESANPMVSMYPLLILVDYIPVFDMAEFLAIPPARIGRIDVVPQVFVLGNARYGGIISLSSRDRDLAGINLPEGSYFFDYDAFRPDERSEPQKHTTPGKVPDTRNTLFWSDQVSLQENAPLTVKFQSPSLKGTYLVLLRGISDEGKPVYGLDRFIVE
jgi:hypothetical protein